ncbi:MAG: DNA-binding response regulator [Frankiales bacterium]|nr:DNA-binding response regulator [Frankiales bacterium]
MNRHLRVVIVDDSALMREVLAAHLQDEPELEVVRMFHDAASLIEGVVDVSPDVVVIDNQMPGGDGIDALAELRRRCPTALVVMWSSDPSLAPEALARGADRFVGKDQALSDVVAAVVSA